MDGVVYVLMRNYEDYSEIVGVFTTLERLEIYRETLKNKSCLSITRAFLDMRKNPKVDFVFVSILKDGSLSTKEETYRSYNYTDLTNKAYFSGNLGAGTKLVCRLNLSKEEAVEVAKEVYQQVVQENVWNNHYEVNRILKEIVC